MDLREWALPVYTILVQMVTGMFVVLWVVRAYAYKQTGDQEFTNNLVKVPVLIFVFTIVMAMIGSHFHLSRPFLSFLAISNFRSSWLSREITFTMIYFFLTTVLLVRLWISERRYHLESILGWGAITLGMITVMSMAFIYLLPTQVAWNSTATLLSYYGTTFLLGTISLLVIFLMDIRFTATYDEALAVQKEKVIEKSLKGFIIAVFLSAVWVVAANTYQVQLLKEVDHESARTSLELLLGLYKPLLYFRYIVLVLGVGCFTLCSSRSIRKEQALNDMIVPVYFACLLVLVSEILERFLFYATHVRIGI